MASSVVCSGVPVHTFVCARGSNLSYQWYNGTTAVSGQTSATLSLPNPQAADAGSYSVVITRSCPQTVVTATSTAFNLTVNSSVAVTAQPAASSVVCVGATVSTMVSASGTGPYTYQWYKGSTPVTSQTTATLSLTNVQVSDAGSYSVVVMGICNSATSAAFSLTVNAPPANPSLVSSGTLTCAQPSVTLSATTSSAGSFSYAFAGSGLSNPSAMAGTATASMASTYSVTVTDLSTGCTSTTATVVESDKSVVSANLVAGSLISCTATSVTLTATPANLTYTFGMGAAQIMQTNQATVNGSGTYSVTVTNVNGCTSLAQVTVGGSTTAPTGATITPILNATLTCARTSITLTASATGNGLSYVFSGPLGGSTGITAQSGMSATVNAPGNYTVLVTGANSCTTSTTLSVSSNSTLPTLSLSPASATLTCTQTSVRLTASSSSAGSFSYAFGGPGVSNASPTAGTATANVAGTYSVTVTDLSTGCTNTATTNVLSDTALPAVSISPSAPAFGCGITSITLTANVSPGASYRWNNNTNMPTLVISASGVYGLSATATNGCTATTPTTIGVGNITLPTVTLVFNNSATVMGAGTPTITIPATPGQQFQALGGSSYEFVTVIDRINGYEIREKDFNTTGVFVIKRTGPFSVTVRADNGCSRTVQGVLMKQ